MALIHGLATRIEQSFLQKDKPHPLQKSLGGMPEKLRLLYDKEKIASLAAAAIAEADTDKDGRISREEWNAWYPEGFGTALGSMKAVFFESA